MEVISRVLDPLDSMRHATVIHAKNRGDCYTTFICSLYVFVIQLIRGRRDALANIHVVQSTRE